MPFSRVSGRIPLLAHTLECRLMRLMRTLVLCLAVTECGAPDVVPPPAAGGQAARYTVRLWSGEELALEPSGDLGENNAGLLIFTDGAQSEYVAWSEVARIDLERSAAQVHP